MYPQARKDGLLTTVLPEGEVVVYNAERESYEHLSAACGYVWQHCDGATSVERLADVVMERFGVSNALELVEIALEELNERGLLATLEPIPALSRRQALQKVAATSAAAAVLPMITTLVLPKSLGAQGVGTPPPPPPPGGQGCTPGYWKTHSHYGPARKEGWGPTGYDPDQLITVVFVVPTEYRDLNTPDGTDTLLDALQVETSDEGVGASGGARILLCHAVSALLSASHPDISYGLSPTAVMSLTNIALATRDRDTMLAQKDAFDILNNMGCPL